MFLGPRPFVPLFRGGPPGERTMRIRKANTDMDKEDVLLIAKASDALAHPARVEIFHYIYNENAALHSVCNKDLVENFDYSQATISQHISKLVSSGLIEVRRKGTYSYYYANFGMLAKYTDAVRKLNSGPQRK